jgi:hypothetical protein
VAVTWFSSVSGCDILSFSGPAGFLPEHISVLSVYRGLVRGCDVLQFSSVSGSDML